MFNDFNMLIMLQLREHFTYRSISCKGKLLPCSIPKSYSRLETYKEIESSEEIDGVYSLQYSPDGSILAVGTGNEAMRVSIAFQVL